MAAYKELADKYPSASEAPEALFTAARIEENVAYYDKAAAFYEQLAAASTRRTRTRPTRCAAPACCARASGSTTSAIKHYGEYAQALQGPPGREAGRVPGGGRARGPEGLARRRGRRSAPTRKSYPGDARDRRGATRARRDAQLKAGNDAARQGRGREGAVRVQRRRQAPQGERERRGRELLRRARRATSRASWSSATTSASRSPGKPRQLAKVLEEKAKRLEEAKSDLPRRRHLQVARVGDRGRCCASARATRPTRRRCATRRCRKDLNADEKQMYRDELEKVVVVIEDKALDAYKSGYAKALTDRRLQQAHADDPAGAVAARRERVPEGGRAAAVHAPRRAAHRARPDRGGAA